MPRLIVNPETEHAWEIPLQPGRFTIGRDPSNPILIEHPSISTAHCEIEVTADRVRLRDLGSTNGSFVNHQPIREADLQPGQHVRLGQVDMVFDNPPPPAPRPEPIPSLPPTRLSVRPTHIAGSEPAGAPAPLAPIALPVDLPVHCRYHPKAPSAYFCTQCQKGFCSLCVNQREGGAYCRACGSACSAMQPPEVEDAIEPGFYQSLPAILAFPFKGSGLWMMLVGSMLFALVDFASNFSRYVWVIMVGYGALYAQGIIHASAQGESHGPQWPDTSGDVMSDIRGACLQVVVTCLLCFAPALGFSIWAASGEEAVSAAILPAAVLGCIYMPMALLAVAMFDSVAAMNPLVVFPAITRIPGPYTVTSVILGLLLVAKWGLYVGFHSMINVPIVPALLASFPGFYLLTVGTRLLGVMYYTQRDRIAWFAHR